MKHFYYFQTAFGKIGIVENGSAISQLCFDGEPIPEGAVEKETALLKEAGSQLQAYLAGRLQNFTLPLSPVGTEYMCRVWNSLRAIPYGETRSYRQIAQELGNAKAARAVGLANNKNPIPIFIPCHRVIGSNGKLVGFRGGIPFKEHLLTLEHQNVIL